MHPHAHINTHINSYTPPHVQKSSMGRSVRQQETVKGGTCVTHVCVKACTGLQLSCPSSTEASVLLSLDSSRPTQPPAGANY